MAELEARKQSVGERAARLLAVPADGVAGVPRAELIGDNEIFLEHYRGILAYGKEELLVDGGGGGVGVGGGNGIWRSRPCGRGSCASLAWCPP